MLALQSEIAIEIAKALEARLTEVEKKSLQKEVSQNITAYDYFLRAREIFNKSNGTKNDMGNALRLVNLAIQLDSNFSRAYALKGSIWYNLSSLGVSQKTWYDSAMYFSAKAISADAASPDGYIVQGDVHRSLGKLDLAKADYYNAYKIAPNDPSVLLSYGWQLMIERDERGADLILKSNENQFSLKDPEYYMALSRSYANDHDFATSEKLLIKAKNLSPGTLIVYYNLAVLYSRAGEYDKAIEELNEAIKINPSEQLIIDALGWTYYWKNDFENAVKYFSKYPEIEASFEDSTQTVPFRARLGMTYLKMGKKKEASVLFAEDKKIRLDLLSGKRSMGAWGNYGNLYYDLAVHEAYSGNDAKAVQYIDSAFHYQFMNLWLYKNDPMFSNLQNRDDFKRVIKKVEDFDQFRKRAFNNALNRMEASKELKDIFK